MSPDECGGAFGNYEGYVDELMAPEDEALRLARADSAREGLPAINVSASEGKLLQVLTTMTRAERVLEIGTLGGYSAIWMARALPAGGRLISLEINEHHAAVARRNVGRAGLGEKIEIRVGPAARTLARMAEQGEPVFDLVFIDADKDGYVDYLDKSLPLLRAGGVLLADNTLRREVLNPDADTGAKRYNAAAANHPALTSIIVPVLREQQQGFDGLTISIKREQ